MKRLVVFLENSGDCGKAAIRGSQDRPLRNREMLPRHKGKQGGCNRAKNLRHQNDLFSTDPVGQMSSGQGKTNDGQSEDQADQTEGRCGMSASVDLPFHGDGEHLSSNDRQKIAGGEKPVTARTKRSIWIMPRPLRHDRARDFRPITNRRFVFVRHARARRSALEHAGVTVDSSRQPATLESVVEALSSGCYFVRDFRPTATTMLQGFRPRSILEPRRQRNQLSFGLNSSLV